MVFPFIAFHAQVASTTNNRPTVDFANFLQTALLTVCCFLSFTFPAPRKFFSVKWKEKTKANKCNMLLVRLVTQILTLIQNKKVFYF